MMQCFAALIFTLYFKLLKVWWSKCSFEDLRRLLRLQSANLERKTGSTQHQPLWCSRPGFCKQIFDLGPPLSTPSTSTHQQCSWPISLLESQLNYLLDLFVCGALCCVGCMCQSMCWSHYCRAFCGRHGRASSQANLHKFGWSPCRTAFSACAIRINTSFSEGDAFIAIGDVKERARTPKAFIPRLVYFSSTPSQVVMTSD